MLARRRSTSLGSAVAIAVLAAGCGSSHQTSSNSAGPHDVANKAFEFSACMRNHGVANFPDPTVSSSRPGQTAIAMVVPAQFASSPQFKSASKACRSILPAAGNINPAQVAKLQQARKQDLLAFARCLRIHGLTNFPDPTSQGQLTIAMLQSAGVDLHAPDVLPAARACIGVTHGAVTWAAVERAVNGNS
ncbi:MAG: hypothetical protein ACLPV4_08490 [Solirubrobacteraceae bacterium]